jgi:beta-lactamase class D
MSEKSFWRLLRNNLPFKTYRVENKVMIGMPDVHYIHKGKTGWIELKYIPNLNPSVP